MAKQEIIDVLKKKDNWVRASEIARELRRNSVSSCLRRMRYAGDVWWRYDEYRVMIYKYKKSFKILANNSKRNNKRNN